MKRLLLSVLSTLMLISLVACSTKKDVDLNTQEVLDQIADETWGEFMQFPIELNQYVESYGLDPDIVSEFAGYAGSMLDANRMILWELKDEKDVEKVKEIMNQERENLIMVFENYMPAAGVVAQASQIIVKGRYVFFVSHEKAEDAIAMFEQQFGKK